MIIDMMDVTKRLKEAKIACTGFIRGKEGYDDEDD